MVTDECDCINVCYKNMKNKQKEWHHATKYLKKMYNYLLKEVLRSLPTLPSRIQTNTASSYMKIVGKFKHYMDQRTGEIIICRKNPRNIPLSG